MRASFLFALVSLVLCSSLMGCGGSSNDSPVQAVGADIIARYNLHEEGQATTADINLPQEFTDANWGLKQGVCQQAGFDLTPYAGQTVSMVKYDLADKYLGDPLSLYVLVKDQTCICAYVAADNLIPGIIAVNDPNINSITSTHQYDPLRYILTSRGIVEQGEIVPITLSITNTGSGLFEVLTSLQGASVQVVKDGVVVWDPLAGLEYPAIAQQISIPAGETLKYDFSWNQQDNTGSQVQSGIYTINASFIGNTEHVDIAIE
jgi:Domain of unknown function (DUF4830)